MESPHSLQVTDQAYDYLFKFIIIGDAAAGKSCLLHYFLERKFRKGSSHTIGVEFGSQVVQVSGKRIKLQIWDTAGQERFRSVTRSYYRGATGALIVYDISNRESYNHLSSWLADARALGRPDISIMVVANKCDREEDREVTLLEASRFAQENDLLFLEASALTGECVDSTFLNCAKRVVAKLESGEIEEDSLTEGLYNLGNKASNQPTQNSCAC